MPMFTVLKQVDAWVNYQTEVEADSAEGAARIACEKDSQLTWLGGEPGDVQEFDHREFYTLDEEGDPLEITKQEIS